MRKYGIILAAAGAMICLTGCSNKMNNIEPHEDQLAVLQGDFAGIKGTDLAPNPAESTTMFTETTVTSAASAGRTSETLTTTSTVTTNTQTTLKTDDVVFITVSTAKTVTGTRSTDSAAASGAVTMTELSATIPESGTGGTATSASIFEPEEDPEARIEKLYGLWETVSFTAQNGSVTAYDLSVPQHRDYYVGMELKAQGDDKLYLGTEAHMAYTFYEDGFLFAHTSDEAQPTDLEFTVSNDLKTMTVSLCDGSVTATLQKVYGDLSIKPYLTPVLCTDIESLSGNEDTNSYNWFYETQDPQNSSVYEVQGYVWITKDSTYTYQPRDGSLYRAGTIILEYDTSDGSSNPFFVFYENGCEEPWIRVSCLRILPDVLDIGNDGKTRLYHRAPGDGRWLERVGQWELNDYRMTVSDLGSEICIEIRQPDGTGGEYIWTYLCIGWDDNTFLECFGGGTMTHIDAAGNQTVIFNDSTARFPCKSGLFIWSDVQAQAWMDEQEGIERQRELWFTRVYA